MSWMDKLQIAYLESHDKSDKTPTFVISVTGKIEVTDEVPSRSGDPDHGIPWEEWKAAELNRIFKEQGATGQLWRITAATIRHSESIRERVDCPSKPEQSMSPAETTDGTF